MSVKLNQAQQKLLLALAKNGALPKFHASTLRVLVDRGFVTSRRTITAAGRKFLADIGEQARRNTDMQQLFADAWTHFPSTIAPAPPPPTPEQIAARIRDEAIWARLEALHEIFWQRESWTNPTLRGGAGHLVDLMALLLVMIDHKLVSIQYKFVPVSTLSQSRWLIERGRASHPTWVGLEQDKAMYFQCQYRKGGDSLKDLSWSAYRELRRQRPTDTITMLPDVPFGVYSETAGSAIMAGNLDAGRVLRVISDLRITSFGVIGYQYAERDEDGHISWPEQEAWQLTQLVFTARALTQLTAYFATSAFGSPYFG